MSAKQHRAHHSGISKVFGSARYPRRLSRAPRQLLLLQHKNEISGDLENNLPFF